VEARGDVYLCGGGALAGSLLDAGLIDRLVLKVNPLVFGRGARRVACVLTPSRACDSGVTLLRHDVK
jgi:riboflavin biosynthesis pyrimidine reductase